MEPTTPQLKPAGTAGEVLTRLLDASLALLAPEPAPGLALPDDDLHREILLPLLPAMIGDRAIRQHWRGQTGSGFFARLVAHLDRDAAEPHWQPHDFEINVASTYAAGPDAKALADTLLSEDALRDLTAALMNQLLTLAWPTLPRITRAPEPAAPEPVKVSAPAAEPAPVVEREITRIRAFPRVWVRPAAVREIFSPALRRLPPALRKSSRFLRRLPRAIMRPRG